MDKFNREFNKQVTDIDEGALEALRKHPWPGNVRELRNAVERAMILGQGPRLTSGDFAFSLAGSEPVESASRFRLPARL